MHPPDEVVLCLDIVVQLGRPHLAPGHDNIVLVHVLALATDVQHALLVGPVQGGLDQDPGPLLHRLNPCVRKSDEMAYKGAGCH